MPSSRTYALIAVLLALPLFAWPLVSPPPEPPDELDHRASHMGPADQFPGGELDYHYEDLSEDGQRVVSAAIDREHDSYAVGLDSGVPEFEYRDHDDYYFIQYESAVYSLDVDYRDIAPSGRAVLSRVGSLLTALVLLTLGGYLFVNR